MVIPKWNKTAAVELSLIAKLDYLYDLNNYSQVLKYAYEKYA